MQLILLIQIAIFFFISPIMLNVMGKGVPYLFSAATVFFCGFLAGLQLGKGRSSHRNVTNVEFVPQLPTWVKFLFAGWTALYIFVVISNDLVFRRQGSDEMAVLYSGLSLSNLLVLRGYEVAFFPAVIAMISSLHFDKGRLIRLGLFVMFLGFLFMGVMDSRAKLLMPIAFYYMIFVTPYSRRIQFPKGYLYLGSIVLFFLVLIIGVGRVSDFDSVSDYFVNDLIRRTDGLELISRVNQEVPIPIYGMLDFRIFINFISAIPFLPEAAALKAVGLTSSKNFLLREILGFAVLDMNNSVIADLFYFGGYFGVAIGATIYGYFVGKFTAIAKLGGIWKKRTSAALLLAFMINCFRIEVDYFSMIISTTRDFFIIYFIFLTIRFVAVRIHHKNIVHNNFNNTY